MHSCGYLKGIFLTFSFTVLITHAHGQALKDYLQKGDRYYQRRDYANALKNYREALALDESDAHLNFRAGLSYMQEEMYADALTRLQKAYALNPDVDPQLDYHLAMAYEHDHQYDRAIAHYESFKSKYKSLVPMVNQKIRECTLADSLMQIRAGAIVRRMEEVNTPFAEHSALLSGDGVTMVFTSDRTEDAYASKSRTNYGDVYLRKKLATGWTDAEKISSRINAPADEAALALSRDGNTLLLYYEEGNGDLYTSSLEGEDWSVPSALNRFVNHPHFRESSGCISPDGKQLFFASNRPGGKGGYDIYVCQITANGQWGRPTNLGAPVNTRGDEEYPFIHEDGTLYFSSNGHPGLGSYDIFKSVRLQERWATPENLGFPINTRGFEGGFTLSRDGRNGYFASRRGEHHDHTDLYEAIFDNQNTKETNQPIPSVGRLAPEDETRLEGAAVLRGTVIDAERNAPLEAKLKLVDNANRMVISTLTTGPSGNFELVIPTPGNYGITTEKPGYLFNSLHFSLPAVDELEEIDTHILMVKAEVGSKVVLKNIFFDVNEAELKAESLSELKNIRDLLIQNPGWNVQINGHTDNVGKPEANLALSLKRAEAVVAYLIGEGISPARVRARGYGSELPLVSNDDESEGRQINRRTEIEIVE